MQQKTIRAMGWQRDEPDTRDQTVDDPEIVDLLVASQLDDPVSIDGDIAADLRSWFSPVEHQGSLNSCTAHAGVALIEYFQRRVLGKHQDVSRLFLYKMARNLLKWRDDDGATLRHTMKAITKFGVPPESLWPYVEDAYNHEPPSESKQFERDYQGIKYYRLDAREHQRNNLKMQICANLVFGLPCVFGFNVFESIEQAEKTGMIPFPAGRRKGDSYRGGHAVVAVGFDNNMEITNGLNNKTKTGAFLIRNSWGPDWGNDGYGWLPYDYVTSRYRLTEDWWSIVNNEWIKQGEFLACRSTNNN